MAWHDIAQICLNGHVINNSVKNSPEFNQDYCNKCGAKTITKCPKCNTKIRGKYHVEGVIGLGSRYSAPSFCEDCGEPFPWTEEKLKAAKELTKELEEISADDKKLLENSLEDIITETPRTELASTRFKKIVSKTSKEVANAFREILIDIASETAKKIIWPDQ